MCQRRKKNRVIWAYKDDHTDIAGVKTMAWTWQHY
jgi:hypothetical protein